MKKIIFVYENGKELSVTTEKSIEELQDILKNKWFINLDIADGKYTFVNLEKIAFVEII